MTHNQYSHRLLRRICCMCQGPSSNLWEKWRAAVAPAWASSMNTYISSPWDFWCLPKTTSLHSQRTASGKKITECIRINAKFQYMSHMIWYDFIFWIILNAFVWILHDFIVMIIFTINIIIMVLIILEVGPHFWNVAFLLTINVFLDY